MDQKELGLLVRRLLPGKHVDAGDLAALMRRLDADGGGTVGLPTCLPSLRFCTRIQLNLPT